jgi:DNA-binding MarR family transcriptional regulator
MSDIAAFLNIGLSSATSMIERLESKALVLRIHDPNDRRVVHCSLTEEGNDALERFWQVQTSKIKAVADILSHEELTKVVESMEILVTALERYDHETESRESLSAEFTQGADRS